MGLDEQVRRVADELEIRNLLARLAQMADDGDLNEYVQLFTEDGSWQGPDGGVRRGRADLLAGAQERRASGIQGPNTNTRHVVTTTVIQLAGDTATGRTYYHYYGNTQGVPEQRTMGVYEDEFRRTAQGWKMARRVIQGPPPP
ncbi:MAG: nuclear transport factor 2 family protein [Chloroflexi bacterium]|nr:nuclear transport factor 2 family protein [Chloroflexota bacterium]MCI0769078.1 nuclear transport factor 2 family protein [Chloroflexota bacterium]